MFLTATVPLNWVAIPSTQHHKRDKDIGQFPVSLNINNNPRSFLFFVGMHQRRVTLLYSGYQGI